MNLDILMLRERSQGKVHSVWFYIYQMPENAKVILNDKKQIKCPGN